MIHCYMQTNRITACLLVISVQAVDQYRKDPRLNQVIYGRVTVTGQQLPTKTKRKQRTLLIHTFWHNFTDTYQQDEPITYRAKELKNVYLVHIVSQTQSQ